MNTTKPSPLCPGDTIALVAPASWVTGVDQIVAALEERGFGVKVAANAFSKLSNFAGTDEERSRALMEAFVDPEVKGVWCMRGGYGCGRILNLLDYEVIRQNPKIFIGMSDITALHIAFTQLSGLTTFLGPVASFLTEGKKSSFAEKELWETLSGMEKEWVYGEPLVSGQAKGRLTGGNLALLASHVGTRWEVETQGKILVLEDVDEYAYRVDRFLVQMEQAALFDEVAGVILGSWEKCKPGKEGDWEIDAVLHHFFRGAPFPVLRNFPTGHIADQVTLPLNSLVELDVDAKRITLLEPAVALERLPKGRSTSLSLESERG